MKFYIFLRFWDALLEKLHLIKNIAFLSLMIAQESGLTMTHTTWEKYSTNWSYAICLWIVIRIGYPPQEHLSPFPASIFRATESLSPGSWFCFSLLACLFKSYFKFIQLWACEPTSNQDTFYSTALLSLPHIKMWLHGNSIIQKLPACQNGFQWRSSKSSIWYYA